jgi:hypothetical protein
MWAKRDKTKELAKDKLFMTHNEMKYFEIIIGDYFTKCFLFTGRWKGNLIGKIARAGAGYDNPVISPVVRQTLQHWGYRLTEKDYNQGKKRVKM